MLPTDSPDALPLFVTDAEIIRHLRLPETITQVQITRLDQNPHSGFPKRQRFFGNRRYWPAVFAYMEGQARARRVPPMPGPLTI